MPEKPPRFDPGRVQHLEVPDALQAGAGADRRDGRDYVYHERKIALAVNVALATGRPLLVSGPSGCGKSTLAFNVALYFKWRFYEFVVTSRTEARDLLWRFDQVRRLNDAQTGADFKTAPNYLEPGVLWWAIDPDGAARRGAGKDAPPEYPALDPCPFVSAKRAVILIDEIDKAEVDVPNNLLVPLGSLQFEVEPLGLRVQGPPDREPPLIIITTNRERELPPAFLRRCVTLDLPALTREGLVEVAKAVLPTDEEDLALYEVVAKWVLSLAAEEMDTPVSTAEFLDTVRACRELGISMQDPHNDGRPSPEFLELLEITVRKGHGPLPR